jgi:hypothetical protein
MLVVIGFPSIANALLGLKSTVDTLQSKLDKVKTHWDELSSREDFESIVLHSYETELDYNCSC